MDEHGGYALPEELARHAPGGAFAPEELRGACRGADCNLFFHPEGERGPARVAREAAAKAVCARCPVVDPCRAHALATREPYGVWGGMSESDRDEAIAAGVHASH